MEIKKLFPIFLFGLIFVFGGCKKYTSNVMLKTKKDDINWSSEYKKVFDEYKLRPGDKIQFNIYTNLGEAIIDPSGNLVSANTAAPSDNQTTDNGKPEYVISESGFCFFPVIGKVHIAGLRISELDSLLSTNYEKFYNQVYIISRVTNKRVIVLGGNGSKIIPLINYNTSLLEVIALYGGIGNDARAYNIRIVRGDLKNPEITVVNLRTVDDMKNTIVNIKPDDIVYIEPVRQPVLEGLREYREIFYITNSLLTIFLLIDRLK